MGERREKYWVLTGRPDGKRPRIRKSSDSLILEDRIDRLSRNVGKNDHYTLRYIQKRADLIYFTVEALNHTSFGLLWTW
jgi:predicted DNA-binding protein